MARSTRKTTTKKNTVKKTTTKQPSVAERKTTRKTNTSKRTTRTQTKKKIQNKRTRKAAAQEESYGWEILPFVVAVIVSIIVVLQSMSSVQSDLALSPTGGNDRTLAPDNAAYLMAPYHHGAAGDCFIDGAQHRKIQAAERAIERSMDLLHEAQMQHEWNCSTDSRSTSCTQAKDHLAEAQELIMERTADLERTRVEACW